MDDRAITDGLPEAAAMLGAGCRKHRDGGDQGLTSGVEWHPVVRGRQGALTAIWVLLRNRGGRLGRSRVLVMAASLMR